ncbi:unnamed protein product, partial [marine sediment metagenome]
PRAENVMFSTLTPKEPFSVNYTTPQEVDNKIKTAFYNRLIKTRDKIYSAINQYYAKHNQYPGSEHGLDVLVEEGFLKESDLLDPWARRYRFTTSGDYISWFNILSAGPDGVFDNEDDINEWALHWEGEMLEQVADRAMVPMAAVAGIAEMKKAGVVRTETGKKLGIKKPGEPRVREFFPETFVFEPALITDAKGEARMSVTMPDAITTWRITAFASSQKGELGSILSQLKVFQEFFVDIDLPVALTEGDEISIPVAIYNYLPREQEIRLVLQEEEWFDILEKSEIKKSLKK